jgi:hypothetical protein
VSDRPLGLCVLLVNDGIDERIDLFRPGDRQFQHRLGADLAHGDKPCERSCILLAVFVESHG